MEKQNESIVDIRNLWVQYITDRETMYAVNGIDLTLRKGESHGLVGETGAGKTTTALSIMQLIPDPPGLIVDGEIFYKGKNIIFNSEKENEHIRGNGISMIFQDPMTALNPIMTIGNQLIEVVVKHKKVSKKEAREAAINMLEMVGVKRDRFNDYPHQLSGGMKQRVVIAMALLCTPEVLIADEPTTALDVTIQAQVLDIINNLIKKMDMAMLLITHDLGIVAETCDRVSIMYAGEIVETGTVRDVFKYTKHPYTRGLFDSIPKLDEESEMLMPIEGQTPNAAALPSGCKFHPRCKYCQEKCMTEIPPTRGENGHLYKCHFDIFK